MEALLSVAIDNISSYNISRNRKGMRQVEGLLAQLCLSSSKQRASNKRCSVVNDPGKEPPTPRKQLSELKDDPAFREFFKLQEGFEWNVAMQLINCLDRLMGKSNDGSCDLHILACLDLIQGVLLLHPPSRALFSRETYMNHLLDLLDPVNCPAIQSATLLTLVCALLETPQNTRTFEALDGLLTVTSTFKNRSTSREVKLKLVEFLYFYLMPETPSIPSAGATAPVPAMLHRSPSKVASAFSRSTDVGAARRRADSENVDTRTTAEKQALLGRHLSAVDDLVADLRENAPFGGIVN